MQSNDWLNHIVIVSILMPDDHVRKPSAKGR
jgi:hypothetical protein